jgi:hypothetical protein
MRGRAEMSRLAREFGRAVAAVRDQLHTMTHPEKLKAHQAAMQGRACLERAFLARCEGRLDAEAERWLEAYLTAPTGPHSQSDTASPAQSETTPSRPPPRDRRGA